MATPLVPQLAGLDPQRFGDGSRPLPRRRLERLCLLSATDEYAIPEVARALRVSPRSIDRARAHPLVRARVQFLRRQSSERAAEDSPLALRGNRIALLDGLARTLHQHLEDNKYEATIAVNKQGQPIEGFDRGRVAELIKSVTALDDMTTDRAAQQDTTVVGVSVTMNLDQAVTRVQALLSRTTSEGDTPEAPPGGIGGYLR
jgi:hypothetical protein